LYKKQSFYGMKYADIKKVDYLSYLDTEIDIKCQ